MRGAVLPPILNAWVFLRSMMCVVAFATSHAAAADDRKDQQPQPGFLSLHQLDPYLEIKADYRYNRVESDARRRFERGRSQTNREWSFEERVGLTLGGTVFDPGFLTFGGDLSFAPTQTRFDEFGGLFATRRDTDHGYLLRYDLRANFLTGKKLSGSVYGLRQDDRINRRFQPTLDERRTGFGTSWTLADPEFPMELSYDQLETDRTGNRDKRDDERFTESTLHYGVRWLIDDHERLKVSLDHSDIEQEFQGRRRRFETIRDLLILEHELEFGEEYQHSFRTLVHWQEESGDFARDLFQIGPQLTLKHSDSLQTLYKVQFNRERYAGLDIETHRADFQLIHQVYSNLTTTLDLFGLFEDIEDDINTTQWGASVDWQYNRKNRFGHLYANLALAYDTEEISGDNGRRLALDEAHTFRDPVAVTLRHRNVVAIGIVVTDASNRRIFQAGIDYLVFRQRNVTRIKRIRNGRIADGDTILVDYQYKTPADGKLDTIRTDFSLEQRFSNGLTPYYRLAYRNQEDEVSSGFARRADRTDHHRVGVTYERKRYSINTEFEIFDDRVEPYDAFHVKGRVHWLQTSDHTLDTSVGFSRFLFEGRLDDRNVTMIDVAVDHRWRLSESLSTVERLGYRHEEDSIDGATQGWDVTVGFQYAVGDLWGELTLEYDRLDLPRSDDENFGVYFRLRRDINHVLARK
ncbi:MAG: hypothetical protein IIC01_00585 [Planctomycetes bacterium]|nr:hypothetical protein [Planctomycetota bacterium]